jgi:hypothetical protein
VTAGGNGPPDSSAFAASGLLSTVVEHPEKATAKCDERSRSSCQFHNDPPRSAARDGREFAGVSLSRLPR